MKTIKVQATTKPPFNEWMAYIYSLIKRKPYETRDIHKQTWSTNTQYAK